MEARLKADILAEAESFEGNILIHDEDSQNAQVIPCWEAVGPGMTLLLHHCIVLLRRNKHKAVICVPCVVTCAYNLTDTVSTPREVYESLKKQGYNVRQLTCFSSVYCVMYVSWSPFTSDRPKHWSVDNKSAYIFIII